MHGHHHHHHHHYDRVHDLCRYMEASSTTFSCDFWSDKSMIHHPDISRPAEDAAFNDLLSRLITT
jgi:cyclopropane fatty-acyl-phospholipid synthase-like methyltransferase